MIIARSRFKTPCNAIFCKLICIDQFDQLTKCFNIMLTFSDHDYQTDTFHDMIKIKISITILIEFSQIKYGNGRGLLHRKKRFLVVYMFEYELFHVLQQQILMNIFISCFTVFQIELPSKKFVEWCTYSELFFPWCSLLRIPWRQQPKVSSGTL